MSRIVWSADKGWHDGQESSVGLDGRGHIVITPLYVVTFNPSTDNTDGLRRMPLAEAEELVAYAESRAFGTGRILPASEQS